MKKVFIIAISAITAISFTSAQDKMSFETWDGNGNGIIERTEFLLNAKKFEKWDKNRDNRLSTEEFQESFFEMYDTDNDDAINQSELQQTNKHINMVTSGGLDFNSLDGDGNMSISENEFKTNVNKIFNPWDMNQDNYISKGEFYDNIFNWWDTDKSGDITRNEFDKAKNIFNDETFWDKIF